MVNKSTRFTILCEDRQQEVFTRHFLMDMGFSRHSIRSRITPPGIGSGEQFVRKNYAKEVKAHRKNNNFLNIGLIVLIDADTFPLSYRLEQLENELISRSIEKRKADEKICIFIPKRNIETWIHFLMGESVDEEDEYAKFRKETECKSAVKNLSHHCRHHLALGDESLASLKAACDEWKRL